MSTTPTLIYAYSAKLPRQLMVILAWEAIPLTLMSHLSLFHSLMLTMTQVLSTIAVSQGFLQQLPFLMWAPGQVQALPRTLAGSTLILWEYTPFPSGQQQLYSLRVPI